MPHRERSEKAMPQGMLPTANRFHLPVRPQLMWWLQKNWLMQSWVGSLIDVASAS